MKLNHIHLTVDDVPATGRFLQRIFGLRPVGEAHKNFEMLLDDDGLVLTLMGVGRNNTVSYPKTFHIGSSSRAMWISMRSTSASRTTGSTQNLQASSTARGRFASGPPIIGFLMPDESQLLA
jgi:hypothetical protein